MFEKEPLIAFFLTLVAIFWIADALLATRAAWKKNQAAKLTALAYLAFALMPSSILIFSMILYDIEASAYTAAVMVICMAMSIVLRCWNTKKSTSRILSATLANMMMFFSVKILAFLPRGDWTGVVGIVTFHATLTILFYVMLAFKEKSNPTK